MPLAERVVFFDNDESAAMHLYGHPRESTRHVKTQSPLRQLINE
jgi:hypothetical protein